MLESLDLPLGVVLGTFGVERHHITWRGQAAHAGSTPMDKRRDALAGAAKLALYIREIAARSAAAPSARRAESSRSRASSRRSSRRPSSSSTSATSTRGRSPTMLREAKEAAERFAAEENIEVEWERIWSIEPILFDDDADRASPTRRSARWRERRTGCRAGPLHDAAEVARAGIPTVMVFVQSLRGLSHTKLEDTKGGAPRAERPGARPADFEGARVARVNHTRV